MDKANNNNRRRYNDDEVGGGGGGRGNFTSLDIPADYDDDGGGSGEYDNQFSSRSAPHPAGDRGGGNGGGGRRGGGGGGGHSPGGNYHNQNTNDRRYSSPGHQTSGVVNAGFQQGDDDNDHPDGARNVRETLEMRRMGESSRSNESNSRGEWSGYHRGYQGIHHRRAKSQHQNGYDYYMHHRRRHSGGFGTEEPHPDYPEEEEDGGEPHRLTMEDMLRTRQFLMTLKIRKKSRNKIGSSRREQQENGGVDVGGAGVGGDGGEAGLGDPDMADSNDGESYEEEIGLPSARGKMKGLAERVMLSRQLDSATEVAQQYKKRESLWEVKHRSYRSSVKRRAYLNQATRSLRDWYSGLSYKLSFWSHHFKEIEGQCGIATTTYFRFTRWLVKINFLVFLIFLSLLYVPQFITWAEPSKNMFITNQHVNLSKDNKGLYESVQCSKAYVKYVENISDYTGIPVVLDIVKGTGLLEDTSIFYGRYSNLSITYMSSSGGAETQVSTDFNMSLVYMLVMLISFFIIFIMIVKTSSKSVRETIMDLDNKSIPAYTNSVFSGWDFCINTEKMAFYKQKIIYNDFQAKLEEISNKRQQDLRTHKEKITLYAKRFFINFLVFCILGGCFTAIVFTTNFLLEKQEEDLGEIESLVIEFLPSMVITAMNFVIPIIFMVLVEKEELSPSMSTSLTIIRAVFLRISLVGVLLFSIYYRLFHERDRDSYFCPEEGRDVLMTTTCCGNPLWKTSKVTTGGEKGSVKCWETYVGQQFYKLAVADFFNVCIAYFGLCAVRKFLWSKFKDTVWCISWVGLPAFDLALEVLDIVYTQTLCWVGMFFAPLLPTFCLFQTFIYFFVKKYTLLRLCEPPKNTYGASRNYSFFQVVLLVTFTMICILLGYMIGNIQPSKGCGPFRVWASPEYVMFDAITSEVDTWPDVPKGIFNFFGTVAFFIPAFLILGMAIYYYWAVSQGYKRLEKLMQQQLKSESYDKQYLLARVDEVIKQGQLNLHEEGW